MIKKFRIYELKEWPFKDAELEDLLSFYPFVHCESTQFSSIGWVAPVESMLAHHAMGNILLKLKREEKIMPPAVINEYLYEKVEKIEQETGRNPSRKEWLSMRDDIILEMLPKAFTKSSCLHIIINPADGYLIVEAGSSKVAEDTLTMLRATMGSLKVSPANTDKDPSSTMTEWARGRGMPPSLTLLDECVMKSEESSARTKAIDIMSDEIAGHLDAGMRVVQIAASYDDRFTFTIKNDLSVTKFKYTDIVEEERLDTETETEEERLDADFALFSAELKRFIPDMIGWFGGPKKPF